MHPMLRSILTFQESCWRIHARLATGDWYRRDVRRCGRALRSSCVSFLAGVCRWRTVHRVGLHRLVRSILWPSLQGRNRPDRSLLVRRTIAMAAVQRSCYLLGLVGRIVYKWCVAVHRWSAKNALFESLQTSCSTLERLAAEQLVTVNLQSFTLGVVLRLSIHCTWIKHEIWGNPLLRAVFHSRGMGTEPPTRDAKMRTGMAVCNRMWLYFPSACALSRDATRMTNTTHTQ